MAEDLLFVEDSPDEPPASENMPPARTLAQVSKFSTPEMMAFMDRGRLWGDPWPEFVEAQKAYLQRVSNIDREADPARWEREMERLTQDQVRVARGVARRVHQQSMTLAACDGDPQTLLAWVDSGDDSECEVCEGHANEEPMTYAERASTYGQLPGQDCLGGSDCRCDLMAVGRREAGPARRQDVFQ